MKPQALALLTHLNSGGTVTRETAWDDFRIQNLTARLSELTAAGYSIVKTPRKALMDGRTITITTWKLALTFNVGDTVIVTKETASLLSLKGRVGTIERLTLNYGSAMVFLHGIGFRTVSFKCLARVKHLMPGTCVSIEPAPYVVGKYHHDADSYTILSANPKHTIVASAALVVPAVVEARSH